MNESGLDHRRRGPRAATALLLLVSLAGTASAQSHLPGVSYFGRSNYIEYIAGELPVIFSEPHGGGLNPAEIPDRAYGTFTTDSNTEDLARKLRTEFGNRFGLLPHVILCRLDRQKIDCNRDIVEGAQGDSEAETAWNEFHNFIGFARSNLTARHGRGFYLDIHGHGHSIQRLELGYLLSSAQLGLSDATLNGSTTYRNLSSIRTLATESALPFATLLRGSNSFGSLIAAEGYPAVPSPAILDPDSDPYFNGGYNTDRHGSSEGGNVDGLQIESNYTDVRDTSANRTAYAQALARTLESFFRLHYGVNLRESLPKAWIIGGGNFATAANWLNGALPVSTNHLLFAGAGGNLNHNLASLATGSGVIGSITFSNGPTGGYTLSGNSFALLRGITNLSAVAQTLNNAITLAGPQTFAANVAPLIVGGNLTNAGHRLYCLGDVAVNGIVSGVGGITKAGAGTLALTAVNSYTGATTNASGVISLNANATFGNGSGLIVLAGGDLLSLNTRSGSPIENPVLLTGSATIFGNGTLTNSLRILPFSSGNIISAGGALVIRNAGANPFASNNVFRVRLTGGGFNFSRPLTVGFVSDLASAQAQLEFYSELTAGDQIFSGTISGLGQLRRDASIPASAGRTILTGANSYSGGTIVNAGTLLANNLVGSATGAGFVAVSNHGTLGGHGTIAGPITCVGTIVAGTVAGTLTVGDGLDLSGGGTNVWELAALADGAEGTTCDQIVLTGGNLVLGGTSKLQLSFIGDATAPHAGDPFWLTSHTWKIVSLAGSASNPGGTRFSTILNGPYTTGTFTNCADALGNVFLAYIAAPAPAPVIQTAALNGSGDLFLALTTESNRTYVLQSTTNLENARWSDVMTNVALSDWLAFTDVVAAEPMRFYRVRVVP